MLNFAAKLFLFNLKSEDKSQYIGDSNIAYDKTERKRKQICND